MPVRQSLACLDITKSTFYHWLKRYEEGGYDALENRKPNPKLVWNKLSQCEHDWIIQSALEKPELSPRELAITYTDNQLHFISESSSYRLVSKALEF